MEKEFIPYEQALELKELGFDEPCMGYYHNHVEWSFVKDLHKGDTTKNSEQKLYSTDCAAPLYQQAFRWLYQKLDIEKGVMPLDTESQQLLLKELIDKVSSKHLLV
jgi:hypothetical protein